MYQRSKRSSYVEIQREPNRLRKTLLAGKHLHANDEAQKHETRKVGDLESRGRRGRREGGGSWGKEGRRLSSITFGYRADADYLLRKCSVVLTAIPIASEERSGAALMRLWASRGPPPSASSAPPQPSAARRPPPPPPHPPPPGSLDPRFFFPLFCMRLARPSRDLSSTGSGTRRTEGDEGVERGDGGGGGPPVKRWKKEGTTERTKRAEGDRRR